MCKITMAENTTVSRPLSLDSIGSQGHEDGAPLTLQSLCMNCRENGETTIFFTKIPHFRELVIYSFECSHCNVKNNEVQFAGAFGDKGVRYTLTIQPGNPEDLSRQIVKSDAATVYVPDLEFEIPSDTQKGSITTIEGLLSDAADNLRTMQAERHQAQPDIAEAIDAFLEKLDECFRAQRAFTFILDDPAGNSYVESPDGNVEDDHALVLQYYERTREQSSAIGLSVPEEEGEPEAPEISASNPHHGERPVGAAAARAALARLHGASAEDIMARYLAPEDVIELPGHCSACGAECATRMYQTSIPFFKEVIIMCNACDKCGYKNSEVKGAGAVSPKGCRITVQIQEVSDLSRDVIKADSAMIIIPELELEIGSGSLGGLITTVEGLLVAVGDSLRNMHSFQLGDSAPQVQRSRWDAFFASLEACRELERPWTLTLADPLANSFVAPCTDDLAADPRLLMEEYERSAEEDEHFAIDHLQRMHMID